MKTKKMGVRNNKLKRICKNIFEIIYKGRCKSIYRNICKKKYKNLYKIIYTKIRFNLFIDRQRGSLSVNVILLFMFLVSLVLLFMPLYKDLRDFKRDYDQLYGHDYELASIEKTFMVNAYYLLEDTYAKSKDSKDFYGLVMKKDTSFYRDLIGQKYLESPHTRYELITGDGGCFEIIKKDNYVEFYVNYYYENKGIERWKRKKYRVYCPFEKLGIDKKVKPKLEIEEIKSLFVELA